ncbi:unnamed protein product [Cylicocyclus nassatus]|uniref:Uncharacterized protein n=1 Tax=Cylicocyclus nassatus TaxID=53992 RepID=A0AA36GW20_CYLNA|nr:unnamed protein product [Cylicocyclus nassatus]
MAPERFHDQVGFGRDEILESQRPAMKNQNEANDGTLRVIRPLIFVRERALREFADSRGLPVVAENCPACFNQATERHKIKQLLAQQELIFDLFNSLRSLRSALRIFPDLFSSLRSALRPLLLMRTQMLTQRTDEMVHWR